MQIRTAVPEALSWTVASASSFVVVWLACSHMYAILDRWQPTWYVNRSCSKWIPRLNWRLYQTLLINNLKNIVVAFVTLWMTASLRLLVFGADPWLSSLTMQLFLCYAWGEVWFYVSHRWVHADPKRMAAIHRQHHEFDEYLYSMVGLYASTAEMMLVNLPLGIGFGVLFWVHPKVLSIWLGVLAWHIANNHSCHNLFPKWFDDPSYHLRHHQYYVQNYGANWIHTIVHAPLVPTTFCELAYACTQPMLALAVSHFLFRASSTHQ